MLKPKSLPASSGAENLAGMMIGYTREMDVHTIAIDELHDAPAAWNFFRPLPDGKMVELIDSIRENGLLVPLIVWERAEGGYTILSGHNRRRALAMLREETGEDRYARASCAVYRIGALTEDEARTVLVDCNWVQRTLSPSEKARAVYAKYVATGRAGKGEGRRYEAIAEQFGLKATQVYQYYRLAQLEPYWLDRLDEGTLSIRAAAHLAKLLPEQREIIRQHPGATPRDILAVEKGFSAEETRRALVTSGEDLRELRVMVPAASYERAMAMLHRFLDAEKNRA